MRYTTEGIEIQTSRGPLAVVARCAGGLAYHPDLVYKNYYNVTHVASGQALIGRCTEYEARKAIRMGLAVEGADWTKDEAHIRANVEPYQAARKAMKAVVRTEDVYFF